MTKCQVVEELKAIKERCEDLIKVLENECNIEPAMGFRYFHPAALPKDAKSAEYSKKCPKCGFDHFCPMKQNEWRRCSNCVTELWKHGKEIYYWETPVL